MDRDRHQLPAWGLMRICAEGECFSCGASTNSSTMPPMRAYLAEKYTS